MSSKDDFFSRYFSVPTLFILSVGTLLDGLAPGDCIGSIGHFVLEYRMIHGQCCESSNFHAPVSSIKSAFGWSIYGISWQIGISSSTHTLVGF